MKEPNTGKNINFNNVKNLIVKYLKNNTKLVMGVALAVILTSSVIYFRKDNLAVDYGIASNKAEQYFYDGDYDNAIKEYTNMAGKDSNPMWSMKIAEVYSIKGDCKASTDFIEKAKKANESNKDEENKIEVLNYIVFTEYMNEDYKSALTDGIEALKLYPNNKKLIKTMFAVYMANSQIESAQNLIKKYPVDEKSAYDMAEYGKMLFVIDDWDEGIKKLRQAWEIDKDEYKIYDVLAQVSIYDRDALLEKVLALSTENPDDAAYKVWLGKIYSSNEATSNLAQQIMDSLKGKDIGKIEKDLISASIYQNSNKEDKANEIIDKVIKENGDDYRVYHTAAWFYLNKKDYKTAEEYCRKSIIKNKDYTDNYAFLMPEILKAQGKSLESEPYFRAAIVKEPYNYNIIVNIANYYWHTANNTEKALEYFKFAQVIKPFDTEIKYNIALLYLTDKKTDEAIKLLKECIDIKDMIPKYHRTLGTVYFLNGKNKEAIEEIRNAYHSDENDILTLNNAGCYYISVESNIERGLYNIKKAKEGINSSTDEYTKKTIEENYDKAKKLKETYEKSKSDEKLNVPEFVLFY